MYDKSLSSTNPFASITALVVDDHQPMAKIIKGMLLALGFKRVIDTRDGKEALKVLEQETVDIIFSDWNMPRMNGLELLKSVRDEYSTAIPFIMVTGNFSKSDVQESIKAGVSEYLIKPFNSNSLKAKVSKAFSSPTPKSNASQAAELEETSNNTPPDATSEKSDNSILIVDDEPNNITVLTELLKNQYSLKACLSGEKALKICEDEQLPDLILLDIMMPKMDGLTVCQKLKENPLTAHIPVIFISALSETKDVVKGLTMGAVDYISKPIIPEVTLARISTHMQQVQQRENMVSQLDTMMENMRLKEDFERITHHDLRNPLAVINSAANTLKEQQRFAKHEIDLILESAHTIHEMLDEQMLIHQLESGSKETTLSSINALELFNKIAYGQKEKCEENDVLVQYKIAKHVNFLGEHRLSFNLFNNLLANAIEASPSGSEVSISLEENENVITFHIHNDGVIPESIQPRFFDKFITKGKASGTGLGTYSAKLSALAQNGEISFSSDIDKGTTLTVNLKAAS